jgi:competence protein ComEA
MMSRALILVVIFCSGLAAQKSSLPDGPGKDVVQRVCAQCHAVEIFTVKGNTRDGWTQVVTEMISRGAQGSDDDFGIVVDYLTANFPPKVNVNKAGAADLVTGLALEQKEAEAIVEYRKQNGNFKGLEDLKKVPGLDAAKLESVKQKIGF